MAVAAARPLALALLLGLGAVPAGAAETVHLAPDDFLEQAFADLAPPEAGTLWLTAELRDGAARAFGRDPGVPRLRYWSAGGRSAWILEAIGKESPITAGFVVEDGRLLRVAVLVYRESRGWEVRFPAFTSQFDGARLAGDALDRSIDNISGATLSVGAMTRMARLALWLHAQVMR